MEIDEYIKEAEKDPAKKAQLDSGREWVKALGSALKRSITIVDITSDIEAVRSKLSTNSDKKPS